MKKSVLLLTMVLVLFAPGRAVAQLKLLVGGAMTEPAKKVGAGFKNNLTTDTSGALQNKLRAGEKADVIIVAAPTMDALEKENRIVPGTRVDLARGLIGVGMRPGAKAPDLSSADAFKKSMLAAKSVSYVDPKAGGTSGTYINGLFQKMGIAQEMQKKTVFRNQGSEVADAIQLPTIYTGAVPTGAPNPDGGRAFLKALKAPAGVAAIKEAGLEPISGH